MEQLTATRGMPLLRMLAIAQIDARDVPGPDAVVELTKSVTRHGILQPLLVRPREGRFSLIAGRRRLAAAREAGLREVPCLVHNVDDAEAAVVAEAASGDCAEPRPVRVNAEAEAAAHGTGCDALCAATLTELRRTLSSLRASASWLPRGAATTRERVAQRLHAAELDRAEWLVRTRQFLAGALRVSLRPVPATVVIADATRCAAAVALHGGTLEIESPTADRTLTADRALLADAVNGLTWTLLALGELAGDARVRVRITAGEAGPVVLEVAQPTAILSQPALTRFFDRGWPSRPGGTVAELGVLLARYAATWHHAALEVSSAPGTGTAVTLML